jgi:hypothetical protein
VIPILCDLDRIDIVSTPLSQFQNALVTKDDMGQVLASINSARPNPMEDRRLKATFEKWWPDFEAQFKSIKFPEHVAPAKPSGAKADSARLDKIEAALEAILRRIQVNDRIVFPDELRSAAKNARSFTDAEGRLWTMSRDRKYSWTKPNIPPPPEYLSAPPPPPPPPHYPPPSSPTDDDVDDPA